MKTLATKLFVIALLGASFLTASSCGKSANEPVLATVSSSDGS